MRKTTNNSETLSTGWIQLPRSLTDKGWYNRSEYVHIWVHLMLSANHSTRQIMFQGRNIYLKPGSVVTGRKKMSTETGVDQSKIERILKFFSSEHLIEQQTDRQKRIITIVSWNANPKNEQVNEQRVNNNRTMSEQRPNTVQEGKNGDNDENIKNEKNNTAPSAFSDFKVKEIIQTNTKANQEPLAACEHTPASYLLEKISIDLEASNKNSGLNKEDFAFCLKQWSLSRLEKGFEFSGDNEKDLKKLRAGFEKWLGTWIKNLQKNNNNGKSTIKKSGHDVEGIDKLSSSILAEYNRTNSGPSDSGTG